jgi:hypothetical protein
VVAALTTLTIPTEHASAVLPDVSHVLEVSAQLVTALLTPSKPNATRTATRWANSTTTISTA